MDDTRRGKLDDEREAERETAKRWRREKRIKKRALYKR